MSADFCQCILRCDVHVKTHRRLNAGVSHQFSEDARREHLCPPSAKSPSEVMGAGELVLPVLAVHFDARSFAHVAYPVRYGINPSGCFPESAGIEYGPFHLPFVVHSISETPSKENCGNLAMDSGLSGAPIPPTAMVADLRAHQSQGGE